MLLGPFRDQQSLMRAVAYREGGKLDLVRGRQARQRLRLEQALKDSDADSSYRSASSRRGRILGSPDTRK